MRKWIRWIQVPCLLLSVSSVLSVPDDVTFPAPVRTGGMGLFAALQGRVETEHFDSRRIHWEVLGNLLWAGGGVNRRDEAGRTVPLVTPVFTLRIYLLGEDGVWLYDPLEHRLRGIQRGDLRAMATMSEAAVPTSVFTPIAGDRAEDEDSSAPVVLLYAAFPQELGPIGSQQGEFVDRHLVMAGIQAGHTAQNIQLFVVSEGIGVKTHAPLAQAQALAGQLDLPSAGHVIMAQSIGYPHPRAALATQPR